MKTKTKNTVIIILVLIAIAAVIFAKTIKRQNQCNFSPPQTAQEPNSPVTQNVTVNPNDLVKPVAIQKENLLRCWN